MANAAPDTSIPSRFLKSGALLAAAAGLLVWGRYVEPHWIEVTEFDLRLPHLPPEFDGYRIAHASDIHIESGRMAVDWPGIAALITHQNVDLICLTGDYVTFAGNWQARRLVEGFLRLHASDGVYAIMGNHDHWGRYGQSRDALHRAGVIELNNEVRVVRRGQVELYLSGVGDLWVGNGDLAQIAARIPDEAASIILVHEPDFAGAVSRAGKFGLQLSGHAHGGQVALPFLGPILTPPYGRKYPRGLYQVGSMFLYTNRGLGTFGPSFRICSRPEITVFTLRC